MKVRTLLAAALAAAALLAPQTARAEDIRLGGKLLLTGGATSVEGAAGGGLASWSIIGGDATDAGIGASAHVTHIELRDFGFRSIGAKLGLFDRVELSVARQRFSTRDVGPALGLPRDFAFGQDIFGAKLRLVGDAVYDQDSLLPQISVGIQHKRARRGAVIAAVGGADDDGTDYLLSATKLILGRSAVVAGTLRYTKANQLGLLGFGGDRNDDYSIQFEGSAGMLLSRRLLVGGEYRTKPDNLGFAREQDAFDLFAAWAAHRHLTITAAYVDLGDIATVKGQNGLYLSAQVGF